MFAHKPTKEKLRQYKTIRASGMKFTIQKLNPLIDFSADKMPQIFTSFITKRKIDPEQQMSEAALRKNQKDMQSIVEVGIVKPEIGKDISIDDIFSDSALALRLYTEIMIHSLSMFRGIRGLFFYLKTRHMFYTEYRRHMERLQTR